MYYGYAWNISRWQISLILSKCKWALCWILLEPVTYWLLYLLREESPVCPFTCKSETQHPSVPCLLHWRCFKRKTSSLSTSFTPFALLPVLCNWIAAEIISALFFSSFSLYSSPPLLAELVLRPFFRLQRRCVTLLKLRTRSHLRVCIRMLSPNNGLSSFCVRFSLSSSTFLPTSRRNT